MSQSLLEKWKDKLAFVGMTYTELPAEGMARYKVKVYDVLLARTTITGTVGIGYGNTLVEAIEDAAIDFNICWSSVEARMTEQNWQQIAHE